MSLTRTPAAAKVPIFLMATPDDIQADVRSFIAEQIDSVAQLELLLLLHGDATKTWSAAEAALKLCTAAEMTATLLAELTQRGLLTVVGAPELRYSYAPRTKQLAQLVSALAQLYHERRVTVITLIYAQPVDKLRSFADAFRIRQDKKEP